MIICARSSSLRCAIARMRALHQDMRPGLTARARRSKRLHALRAGGAKRACQRKYSQCHHMSDLLLVQMLSHHARLAKPTF
jgi:hypothetical protein